MAEQKKVRRSGLVGTKISSAKSEFEARLNAIEATLRAAILGGTVNTVDSQIYSAKAIASSTQDLMESADAKTVGKTNINKRQLDANTYALITGVQLLQGDTTSKTVEAAQYGIIDEKIANGELEIKNGDKTLFPRNSCEVFRTTGKTDCLQGYYRLECPKMLVPLTDIIPTLWLASTPANTAAKIVLHGVRTNKA